MAQSSEGPPRVQELEIADGNAGQRIDNFLVGYLKGVPRTYVYRILRKGEVRVNKGRIKPSYRLRRGDRVRIPPVRTAAERPPARPPGKALERLGEAIVKEDKWLLVLDKPAGMAVHGGSGLSYGVIEALRALRPEAPFLELAHRLDRDTSGCLVIAKRRSALRSFHKRMRGDGVDKRYLALVEGRWQGGERRVDAPLRKNVQRSGERVVTVDPSGKPALSLFRAVAMYEEATLMEVRLVTGRTHQVRVHAAHCGHPIAGDEKYGDPVFNRRMAALGLGRLFLHAVSLAFPMGERGGDVDVHCPLPPELRNLLDKLEK